MKVLRRSTRHGRRRSTRVKRAIKKPKYTKGPRAVYDRDMGGYKLVPVFGNKWKRTNREYEQLAKEKKMVKRMEKKAKRLNKEGYEIDDTFFVADDAECEIQPQERTVLDDADDILDSSSSSSDDEQPWDDED